MASDEAKKDYGQLFEEADSPGTVRLKENALHVAMAKQQSDDSALLTKLFSGLTCVMLLTYFGWCGLFPFYPCIDNPELSTIEAMLMIIMRFAAFLAYLQDGAFWVLEQNLLLLNKFVQLKSITDFGEWFVTSYIPRLGSAFLGLICVNALSLVVIGMVWSLMLMCATKTCCFCKKGRKDQGPLEKRD
jgi:hypothetical protein